MSRIGKHPIAIPAGVDVTIDGSTVTVKGPTGTLNRTVHSNMNVAMENGEIVVTRPDEANLNKSLHGLTRTLIHNMVCLLYTSDFSGIFEHIYKYHFKKSVVKLNAHIVKNRHTADRVRILSLIHI